MKKGIKKDIKRTGVKDTAYNSDEPDTKSPDTIHPKFMVGDFIKTTEMFYVESGQDFAFPPPEYGIIVGRKTSLDGMTQYACRFRDSITWGRTLDGLLRNKCGRYINEWEIELDN